MGFLRFFFVCRQISTYNNSHQLILRQIKTRRTVCLRRVLFGLLIGAFYVLLSSCSVGPNNNWKPWIGASLIGFSEGKEPEGFINAVVFLWDESMEFPIIDAEVTLNGVTLIYSPASGGYLAAVTVQPGDEVTLLVSSQGRRIKVTGTQFTAYPVIVDPLPEAVWEAGSDQNVLWTEGAPISDAEQQWVTVLDEADPNGSLVYPFTELPMASRAHTFGARSVSSGERIVIVGMDSIQPIPDAAPDSFLVISGCDSVQVTIRGRYMTMGPLDDRMAQGSVIQYRADVYSYFNSSREIVTESAVWTCSDQAVAMISNDSGSKGLATPVSEGTTTVTAAWENLSVSTNLTVLPWTIRSSGTNESLYDIAASDSLIIAVGRNGTIVTSPDSVQWTMQNSGTTVSLNGVTWAGTRFVAVGSRGLVLTSPDGITWSPQDSGTGMALTGVAWSGTGLVAVGHDGILSSPDGENWTIRRDLTQLWSAVACSGTTFVAAGPLGVLHSIDDGVTWDLCEGSLSSRSDVAWTGDRFMAVGSYSRLITSTDGSVWTDQIIGGTDHIFGVAGNGDHFIMVARRTYDYQALILMSRDGIEWDIQLAETGTLSDLIWYVDKYVALGSSGKIITIPPPAIVQMGETKILRAVRPSVSPHESTGLLRQLLMTHQIRRQ